MDEFEKQERRIITIPGTKKTELDRPEFSLERDFDSLMNEFKPSFRDKKIYPYILPMSHRFVEAMRPELRPKKGNLKKVGRNDRTRVPWER
jgi:hypothetical protein